MRDIANPKNSYYPSAAGLEELLAPARTLNPGVFIEELPRWKSVAVRAEDKSFVYVLPYDRTGTIIQNSHWRSTVFELTGKKRASTEAVIAALEKKHGLKFPAGFSADLRNSLVIKFEELTTERLTLLGHLREAFSPLIEAITGSRSERTLSEAARSVSDFHVTNKVLRRHYDDYDGIEIFKPVYPKTRLKDIPHEVEDNLQHNWAKKRNDLENKFPGHFSEFLITLPNEGQETAWDYFPKGRGRDAEVTMRTANSMATPIGSYGADFSRSLQATTKILSERAYKSTESLSEKIYRQFQTLIETKTARGEFHGIHAPRDAMVEGIVSMNQAIMQLMAEEVPGTPAYREALHKIIFPADGRSNGLLNEYVQKLSMGTVGPLSLGGRYFPKPVLQKGEALLLNEELNSVLGGIKKNEITTLERERSDAPGWVSHRTGIGCPLAFGKGNNQKSEIQKLAESFYDEFIRVDDSLNKIALEFH